VLDVVDQRSLLTLLDRGGVRQLCETQRPAVDALLQQQRFLENARVLDAVKQGLESRRDMR
jgi:hypothetical protein